MTSSFAKNDEARHLARVGLAASPLTRSQKLSVQLTIDVEQAWCKLEAAAVLDRLDSLRPEVERRERLFREHRRQLGLPLAEHPTLACFLLGHRRRRPWSAQLTPNPLIETAGGGLLRVRTHHRRAIPRQRPGSRGSLPIAMVWAAASTGRAATWSLATLMQGESAY